MSAERVMQLYKEWHRPYENNEENPSELAARLRGKTIMNRLTYQDLVALDGHGIQPTTAVLFGGHKNGNSEVDPMKNRIVTAQMAMIACSFAWPSNVPGFNPDTYAHMFLEARMNAARNF